MLFIKDRWYIYNLEWNKKINIDFNAINLEVLYENIVKTIINKKDDIRDFENIIDEKNRIDELNKKIINLRNKIKSEKQFDRKLELNTELNKLLNEMEEFNNE